MSFVVFSMTNILTSGAQRLGTNLKAHAGTAVTYRRGQRTISLTATKAAFDYTVVDEDGFATRRFGVDWTVTAADLGLASERRAGRPRGILGFMSFVVFSMTNILTSGAQWLGTKLKAHAGTAVTYRRGQLAVSLTATLAMVEHLVDSEDTFATAVTQWTLTITAADLMFAGETVIPKAGDRVETAAGQVFEVLPPASSKQVYDPADAAGTLFMVSAKRVK